MGGFCLVVKLNCGGLVMNNPRFASVNHEQIANPAGSCEQNLVSSCGMPSFCLFCFSEWLEPWLLDSFVYK